ncbi:hypothetical protein CDD83_4966 [Cordyceps sp. RAO-2017]|nr:hypothetical protein CDD83_4966 [Cordyceps sp. RAO-2017]
MPARFGPEKSVLRVVAKSGIAGNDLDALYKDLRKLGVAVQTWDFGLGDLESTGNLETIIPHDFNGRRYPISRIMIDSVEGTDKISKTKKFLRTQELQEPLILSST